VENVTGNDLLTTLQNQFTEATDSTTTARAESELHRAYFDGVQWTPDEIKVLTARNQAPIVDNQIKDKIEYLLGLERRSRTDPKAFPRNPSDEQAAEAATDALRFIADENEFQQVRSSVAENMLIEGCGACEVVVEQGTKYPKIKIRRIRWDRFYYDPYSMDHDFGDANYLGIVTWMDATVAERRWKKAAANITESMTNSANAETYDDRPRWVDVKRKRVQVFETYYRENGEWMRAVWFKGGFLEQPEKSVYVDEDGATQPCIVAQSLYIGLDGDRYGMVRRYKTLQDEINHRRSKALHMLNNRQVVAEKGAVEDVAAARREVAKPDGYIEINPGMRFEYAPTTDLVQGQFNMLVDTLNAMRSTGPNDALQGNSGSISGRAKQLDQEGGAIQLGTFFDAVRYFQRRVMKQCWFRVKQFWTEEMWIRVRDDEGRMQFVPLNQRTTAGEIEAEKLTNSPLPPEEKMARVQQIAMDAGAQAPVVKNNVATLDVDIVIDESPDTVTLQAEQFEQIVSLAQAGIPFPPEVLLEASALRNKRQLIDKLKGADNPQIAQQQQEAASLGKAKAEADIRATNAKANKDEVSAAVDLTSAAREAMAPPEQTASVQ